MKRYIIWIVLVVLLLSFSPGIEARITNPKRTIQVSALDMCNLSIDIELAKSRDFLRGIGADPKMSYCMLLNDGRALCNLLFLDREKAMEIISLKNPSAFPLGFRVALLNAPIAQWYGEQKLNDDDIIINVTYADFDGIKFSSGGEWNEIGYIIGDKVVKGKIFKTK